MHKVRLVAKRFSVAIHTLFLKKTWHYKHHISRQKLSEPEQICIKLYLVIVFVNFYLAQAEAQVLLNLG